MCSCSASSLGARVHAGDTPEVGVLPVMLTDEGAADAVLSGLPRELPTLQWHGDTFDLPDGAVRLAGSPAYPNQAFRWGRAAYGVQFHLEVTGGMAREWAQVPAYVDFAGADARPGLGRRRARCRRLRCRIGPTMQDHARVMFERWVDVATAAR